MNFKVLEELRDDLQSQLSAVQLAGALLEHSELADSYPSGFAAALLNTPVEGPVRTLDSWIQGCGEVLKREPTADEAFFCLVLLDDGFASLFERSQPTNSAFTLRLESFQDSLSYRQTVAWDQRVGAAPTPHDRALLPGLARAVDRGRASFQQLAVAQRYSTPRFNKNAETGLAYGRFFPLILKAFEAAHGPVIDEYWCTHIAAAVLRTEQGDIHMAVNDMSPPAIDLADRCEDLYRAASEHLSRREANLFKADIYGLCTAIYSASDVAAARQQRLSKDDFRQSEQRYAELEIQIKQRMERRAQRWYILGTGIGLVVAALILGVASVIAHGNWQQLFEGAIFGAAGALASVLLRMHRGALRVEATQDSHLVAAAALVRPLMGALFGAVVCSILLSGLLPIEVTGKEPERFYYLGSAAFLAGFGERWAPSLLELAGAQLNSGMEQRAPEGS